MTAPNPVSGKWVLDLHVRACHGGHQVDEPSCASGAALDVPEDEPPLDQPLRTEPLPELEVEITENPVLGQLFHPDGSVLIEIRQRAVIPFGFGR